MTPAAAGATRTAAPDFRLLGFLPRALRVPERPGRAILVGWLTTFLPSLALAAAAQLLMPGAGQPPIRLDGFVPLLIVVLFAPIAETLIMAAVLAVLVRLAPPALAVIISAVGWGLAHSYYAPAWGLVIWWPFLVFSTLFVVWRQRSPALALAIPAAVHMLHNSVPAAMIFAGIAP